MTEFTKLNIDKSSWVLTQLGDLAEEISKREDNPSSSDFDRFVGLEHFVSGELKIKDWKPTDDLVSAAKVFKSGDILFARRNAYLKRASMVEFNGVCSGDAFVLRENHEMVVPGFLAFVVNSTALWEYANSNAAGTMSKRVKWRDLAEYQFLLPPKDQQAKIAELLWAMDDVVEKEKKMLLSLETVKKTTLLKFLVKGNQFLQISDLGEIITGRTPSTKDESFWGSTIPFVTPVEIDDMPYVKTTERYLTQKGSKQSRLIPANSILTVCIGSTIGKIAINKSECCTNQQINSLIPDKQYPPTYLLYLLRFNKSKIHARTGVTAVPIINKNDFSKIKIKVQNKNIREEFVKKVKINDSCIAFVSSKITKSRKLQKTLINKIFSS